MRSFGLTPNLGGFCIAGLLCTAASAQMRITEYEYSGAGVAGEFVEFTNVGATSIDMSGWTYDDSDQLDGPRTSLTAFGVVAPGDSVIMCETSAATFIDKWNLSGVSVIGDNENNLGRNDQINLWNASNVLVDQLNYGDQTFPGTIRADGSSGWPCSQAVGNNAIAQWRLSEIGDQQTSGFSDDFNLGKPGTFVTYVCPPDPTGACCAAGVCTIKTQQECTGVGLYQGNGTNCGITCPSPSGANVRISEYLHTGAGGEFIEFRNFGGTSVNMTGWSFSDETRVPGQVSLSAYGTIVAGEEVILTETVAGDFEDDWNLAGVKIIGGNSVNIGAADELNLYDNSGALVDRLTYGAQSCSINTEGASGWPCSSAVGSNDILEWRRSTVGDGQNSQTSLVGDIGNPGSYTSVTCQSGSCCIDNACSIQSQGDCLAAGGFFFGSGTNCTSHPCPAQASSSVRITEFMYQGTDGEFFELTNVGTAPVSLSGWTFGDSCVAPGPGTFSLSALGTLDPGESAIVTDMAPATFAAAWSLTGVTIMQLPTSELGRNDQLNIFNNTNGIVDRLEYGDQEFPGSVHTSDRSAWPLPPAVGADAIHNWKLSVAPDGQLSIVSTGGDIGNPGRFTLNPIPTVSTWGVLVMALLLVTAGSLGARRTCLQIARR